MNDDLIKRTDAIETAYQLRHKPNDEEWGDWLKSFNAIPSADRPQGKRIFRIEFVEDTQFTGYRCSNCNYWQGIGVYNYCPNCGCRMKGADDE